MALVACSEVAVLPEQNTGQELSPGPTKDSDAGEKFIGKVTRVVDGDTADVAFSDGAQAVRFLGVDTPEISPHHSNPTKFGNVTDIACLDKWGDVAAERMTTALEGKIIELVLDPQAPVYDSFGRVLAYVYLGAEDMSRVLLEEGLARVYEEGDSSRIPDYVAVQNRVRAERGGLWACEGDAGGSGDTTSLPNAENCDPSYPDVCIPSPPPDLDCPDIQFRRFRVVGDDPHRFDVDRNGIGCEG